MKESKVLGALLPALPEYQPMIKALRDKYNLPEISLDDEPIKEIFINDQPIALEEFHQEIFTLVQENSTFLDGNEQFEKLYKQGKQMLGKPYTPKGVEKLLPQKTRKAITDLHNLYQDIIKLVIQLVDEQYKAIADIIYIYLLTGEAGEVPEGWFSRVGTVVIQGNPHVFVMASQVANPDVIVQQFHEQYTKTFGIHKPKLTKTMVTTAYYLRLKKMGKKWDYIVEEFIRINKFTLPRDRASKRYFDVHRKYEQVLKKRMQRSQAVLEVIARDIK